VISFYLRKPYTDNVDNEASVYLLNNSLLSSSLPLRSAQIRVHCASKCVPGAFSPGFKRTAASGERSVSICYRPVPPYLEVLLLKHMDTFRFTYTYTSTVLQVLEQTNKGKGVPLQAWTGPEGSRKLRLADFATTAQDGGKVVSLTHRPPLPPENTPGTYLC